MNFYLIIALYVLIGGLGIGIFIYGTENGNSIFSHLYRFICIKTPRAIKRVLEKCFGKRAPEAMDACWMYVAYTSNPIVQVFYLLVVVGGYGTFVAYGYPHLPNEYLGRGHKYVGFAMFTVCLSVWWKACTTDPGTVTPSNVDKLCEVYEFDNTIFCDQPCKTCRLRKPARSKHCSLCNICIAKFDHHCIWINNCVGVGNHKYFLGFLFAHLTICFYGLAIGTTILMQIIAEKDLFNATFINPQTKERHKATYVVIFQYMLATEGMVLFVSVVCLVMGLVLFGFFLWHLNLVRTGTTTNELSKWNYVKWCLKHEENGEEHLKSLKNIYNQGMVKNFVEVFSPLDVHNLNVDELTKSAPDGGARKDNQKEKDKPGKKTGKSKKS
eukprot:TRINITY_DN41531_c0_g1_i1.p1 TRINITY_DN41531_c0_g1~~TRINITY_DN41531_c0_g1_i1.p1  ORF type:complete len:383 (+),score=40.72 TRINITY_DN41531_c0_g1_i1:52-1200(+)